MPLRSRRLRTAVVTAWLVAATLPLPRALAWDSDSGNPTHATHSSLTEWAVGELCGQFPEVQVFRQALIDGANTELHELPARAYEKKLGARYGVDLEAQRVRHKGTNEGCDDAPGWWAESVEEYRHGNKERAYFLFGVLLHMVEDMGVPSHANHVYHQGYLREFDHFEYAALWNWRPKFDDINRTDPGFTDPWRYYALSRDWTHSDAPDYLKRDAFPKTWARATAAQRTLLQNRQGRTCTVVKWALSAACRQFSS